MYLVVGGKKEKTGVNRWHATAWYTFADYEKANEYADDLARRHPKWLVAVVNPMETLGPHPEERIGE